MVSREFLILLRHEIRSIRGVAFMFIIAVLLVGTMFAVRGKLPLPAIFPQLFVLPIGMSVIALSQFLQIIVLADKLRGTFSVLRRLPVSDTEIIGAKTGAIMIGVSATYLLPCAVIVVAGRMMQIGFSPIQLWGCVWLWFFLLLNAMLCVGAAIFFSNKYFSLVPAAILSGLLGIAHFLQEWQPGLLNLVISYHLQAWLLPLPVAAVYAAWLWTRGLFIRAEPSHLVH